MKRCLKKRSQRQCVEGGSTIRWWKASTVFFRDTSFSCSHVGKQSCDLIMCGSQSHASESSYDREWKEEGGSVFLWLRRTGCCVQMLLIQNIRYFTVAVPLKKQKNIWNKQTQNKKKQETPSSLNLPSNYLNEGGRGRGGYCSLPLSDLGLRGSRSQVSSVLSTLVRHNSSNQSTDLKVCFLCESRSVDVYVNISK